MARNFKRDAKGRFARVAGSVKKESARRKSAKKKYKGKGGYARKIDDYSSSSGKYAKNRRGKKVSKARKINRKVTGFTKRNSVAYVVSKRRGAKRKKKR